MGIEANGSVPLAWPLRNHNKRCKGSKVIAHEHDSMTFWLRILFGAFSCNIYARAREKVGNNLASGLKMES
jgi:hypothetical protein